MSAALIVRPSPSSASVLQLAAAGGLLVPLPEADSPEAIAPALARLGYVAPDRTDLPQLLDALEHPHNVSAAPLVVVLPIPANAYTCPPWCRSCALALDLWCDPITGRAVLTHHSDPETLGSPNDTATWRVEAVAEVLLDDPPRFAKPAVRITPSDRHADLTPAIAVNLAHSLRRTAAWLNGPADSTDHRHTPDDPTEGPRP